MLYLVSPISLSLSAVVLIGLVGAMDRFTGQELWVVELEGEHIRGKLMGGDGKLTLDELVKFEGEHTSKELIWEVETILVATLPTAGVDVEDLRFVEVEDFWAFSFFI